MPTSDLLTQAYLGTAATNIPTGFGNVYDDTFDETLRTRQPTAYLLSVAEEGRAFSERNELIRQRFGRDIVSEVRKENPEAGADFLISEYQKRTDQLIEEGRNTNMAEWQGIRKAEEIQAEFIDKAQTSRIEAERTRQNAESDFARVGGSLAGGVAASFLDPINLATLPLGAGAGMGILRGAMLDGVVNMGVEAAEAPANAKWQGELGFKYGLGDAVGDIATAGLGGAGLSALIRGGAKALGTFTGRSEKLLRGIADDTTTLSEVRDAAKYMERVAHIDENQPTPARLGEDISNHDIVAAHRANAQEIQDAFQQHREPVFNEDIPFDITDITPTAASVPAPAQARNFEEGAATGAKFENYTRPNPQETRYMEGVVAELNQAEKGSIIITEKDGQGSTNAVMKGADNTFPQWFRDLNKEGESLSKGYVQKVFDKIQKGEPLAKKEVRVAKVLFEEARAIREENARQILNFRQDRADARTAEANAAIDATAAREAEREMGDPYLAPMPHAAQSLAEDIAAAENPAVMDAAYADFARLLKDEPDFALVMEDGSTKTMADIAQEMEEEKAILQAVTMCGVG